MSGKVFSNPDLVYLLFHPVVHFSRTVCLTLTSAVPLSNTATVCHTKSRAHAVINQCRQCHRFLQPTFSNSGTGLDSNSLLEPAVQPSLVMVVLVVLVVLLLHKDHGTRGYRQSPSFASAVLVCDRKSSTGLCPH